jgi:S-adenosylmethionine:tRNA ribosyltransferase-isomerase
MLRPFQNIDLKEFTYDLPESRIATFPESNRGDSLLLVHKPDGSISQDLFHNLSSHLDAGSHLVFNNSRVIPARLIFTRPTGSRIELFCLTPTNPAGYEQSLSSRSACVWECMAGNLKKFKDKEIRIHASTEKKNLTLSAEKAGQSGNLLKIRFSWLDEELTFAEILSVFGKTPLPPYIKREAVEQDREWYQTVYAKQDGSVAAPTAGLHFTDNLLDLLVKKGITLHEITLHVGAGTFQPIKSGSLQNHNMHGEFMQVSRRLVKLLSGLNKPVVAVGTTSVRTLESLYWLGVKIIDNPHRPASDMHLKQWEAYELPQDISVSEAFSALDQWLAHAHTAELYASTHLMIIPGYRFRVVNTMITNFHQPGSTLLLLVAAFVGKTWKNAYQYALDNGFRFLSYGDSSLLFAQFDPLSGY